MLGRRQGRFVTTTSAELNTWIGKELGSISVRLRKYTQLDGCYFLPFCPFGRILEFLKFGADFSQAILPAFMLRSRFERDRSPHAQYELFTKKCS